VLDKFKIKIKIKIMLFDSCFVVLLFSFELLCFCGFVWCVWCSTLRFWLF